MQSASCVTVKWVLDHFRDATCNSGNLKVVSYNSVSLLVASCELIIKLWVGSCASLHYVKFALSVYLISTLHAKLTKSSKVILYIPIMIYTWEQR